MTLAAIILIIITGVVASTLAYCLPIAWKKLWIARAVAEIALHSLRQYCFIQKRQHAKAKFRA
jgi:UPF0716 family protein affecting phage T7 exclusion